jgi:FKBP-type peptidyl-prolyl cis-trans isomerase
VSIKQYLNRGGRRSFGFIAVLALVGAASACGGGDNAPSGNETGASNITTLQITDVKVGSGAEATAGKTVSVHYTGWLYSESAADHHGSQFDSSRGGQPLSFVLGAGSVIKGWDQGIAGMKVGGQRTLVIPPSLAYGSAGYPGAIPGNATLVFDVELLNVQ